jgi:hypothetical protein
MNEPESHDDNERKRKNRPGRSARRRKAKLKAIQAAEERIWSGDTAELIASASVPTDRHKVWPGVLERRKDNLTSEEEAALVGQLGYLPGNAICVAARAHQIPAFPIEENVPIVLKLYPLAIRDVYAGGKADGRKFKGRRRGGPSPTPLDNEAATDEIDTSKCLESVKEETPLLEPFPTIFWLTHPILRTLTSKLELGKTDNVSVMEARLQSDPQAMESMARAHQAYGQERWESLTDADLDLVKTREWEAALDAQRGVAGIRKPSTIKCLHTHLAHYLSGGRGSEDNIVGKWAMESIIKLLQEKKQEKNVVDD